MSKYIYITALFFCLHHLQAQLIKSFPKTVFTAQFAGSTGLYTFGISKITPRDKLEIGLLYGRVPLAYGGINNALVLKTTYNPFQFNLFSKINLEPIQTGIFLAQNFNRYSGLNWSDKYPPGYYWWTRSLRFHFFIGSQVSLKIDSKRLDRLSLYMEANTNDLYIASYVGNRKSLGLVDIFFLGTGLKLYLN